MRIASKDEFNSILNNLEIKKEDISLINEYVTKNKDSWDVQLQFSKKEDSLFLRSKETGLSFSLQYWKDGEWVVHSKMSKGNGGEKKLLVSVDLVNKFIFARMKPLYSSMGYENIIRESKIIDTFSGMRGIIQNYRTSYYQSKNNDKVKFEILQELQEGTFDLLENRSLSKEERVLIMKNLMSGLAVIHEKGLIHADIKPKNILFQIDSETNQVVDAVLCDFGSTTDGKSFLPPFTSETLEQNQRSEVNRLLGLFRNLHRSQKIEIPEFIDKLSEIPNLPFLKEMGIMPRASASAKEVLEILSKL